MNSSTTSPTDTDDLDVSITIHAYPDILIPDHVITDRQCPSRPIAMASELLQPNRGSSRPVSNNGQWGGERYWITGRLCSFCSAVTRKGSAEETLFSSWAADIARRISYPGGLATLRRGAARMAARPGDLRLCHTESHSIIRLRAPPGRRGRSMTALRCLRD